MKNINPLSAYELTVRPVLRYRPESVQARTPHAPWTPERVERLKALAAEGYSRGEIAKRLGNITRNAVIGKLGRLGVASKKVPRIRAAALSRQPRTPKPSRQAGASQRIGTRYSTLTSLPLSAPPKDSKIAPLPAPHADDLPRVSFMDLEPHHCRWPSGDPVAGFCGCTKVDGLPYCADHAQRAYAAPQPRPRPILGLVAHVMRSDVEGHAVMTEFLAPEAVA